MNEMIERGVAALKRLPVRDFSNPGGELDELRLREAVRTVIETMRVPTQGMLDYRPPLQTVSDAKLIWQHQIDEALK